MAYNVTQDKMEEMLHVQLGPGGRKGGAIGSMLSFEFVSCDAEKGELVLRHVVPQAAADQAGNIHSGIISWLMDTAMGTFAWSYLGFERSVTVDIHVNHLETVKAGDEIIITSRLAHAGRRTVNVNGQAAVDGMLCATADAIFYKIEA